MPSDKKVMRVNYVAMATKVTLTTNDIYIEVGLVFMHAENKVGMPSINQIMKVNTCCQANMAFIARGHVLN